MKTISGKARLAGVMGWPVGHSLSPRLHGFWLQTMNIDGAYVPLAVSPENAPEAISSLSRLGFRGLNVTAPHKETALKCVDVVDENAQRIGAVNTIVFDEEGRSHGSNTDGYGFIENIRQHAPDIDLSSGPAVVLGAGGAARAIIVALMDAGAPEIRVLNRTLDRAVSLVSEIRADAVANTFSWDERARALADTSLLVNTTTLGMTGQPPLEIGLDTLPKEACVTDIVYSPLETDLLARARRRGNRVVDGLGMLLHQARPGFRAWFGREPEVNEALRSHVLEGT